MQVGIPFFSLAEGINLGPGIDDESFYIGLWDTHKAYLVNGTVDYYTNIERYKLDFNKDITELMAEIRRV